MVDQKAVLVTNLTELQKGLDTVMQKAEARIEEMAVATEGEVRRAEKEKETALESLRVVQAQVKQLDDLQLQVDFIV